VRPRSILRYGGMAISLLCLAYVAIKVVEAWQSIGSGLVLPVAFTKVGAALIPILLGYMTAALAWVVLVRALGLPLSPLTGAGIYLTTQIAKYLPGNVGHYAGRVALSMQRGYPPAIIMLSMTVELILALAIAALFSLPTLRTVIQNLQSTWDRFAITSALTALALLFAMLSAAVLAKRRWPARVHDSIANLRAVVGLPTVFPGFALAALLLAVSIGFSAVSLLALDGTPVYLHMSYFTAVLSLYSVAWIAGVLTPGAPAGIGVREAILVQGLTPLLGATEAVTSTLLFRLLTTMADAIVFVIGMLMLRFATAGRDAATLHL